MKQVTIENLKRTERERGKKEAAKELEEKAKQNGFASLDEALKFAADQRANGSGGNQNRNGNGNGNQRNGTGQNGNGARAKGNDRNRDGEGNRNGNGNGNGQQAQTPRQDRRERQSAAKIEAERVERLRQQRRADATQRQLHATEAEYELKLLARDLGIRDPDYAVALFVRECQGKSEEDLGKFDEKKFFEGLKDTRPHLFVDPIKPANTGTTAGGDANAPPPPGAGKVNAAGAQAGQFDARKASNEEWRAELKKRGLKAPGG